MFSVAGTYTSSSQYSQGMTLSLQVVKSRFSTASPTQSPTTASPTTAGGPAPTPNPVLVHKVRVQLEGRNYLHMREVQVYDTSGVNHALNKLATQSSPFYWGEIRSGWNSKCLEYDGNNHLVFMWDCHGGSNQQWYP